MYMRGILRDLQDANTDVRKKVEAIWHYAHSWLSIPKDEKSSAQKATIKLYDVLSESYALTLNDLSRFTDKYQSAVKSYCDGEDKQSEDLFISLQEDIKESDIVPILDRVEKYRYGRNTPIYIARARGNEYFIAANGKLRRNFPYFDAWLRDDKDFLIEFYTKSIKQSLKNCGYLVFINKRIGPHGPIKIMDELSSIFKDFGILTIENGSVDDKKPRDTKDYCILYDLLLTGDGIKSYETKINQYNADFRLKSNIVLYNEKPDSNDFVLSKTTSLLSYSEYKKLLLDYPKAYTPAIRKSSALEDFMFALGSSIGFGDNELGARLENFTRTIRNKLKVSPYAN